MFAILTDTSSNIPTEITEARHIFEIPYHYHFDGKDFTCGDTREFNGTAYYEMIHAGTQVRTSQVNPQDIKDFFESFLKEGKDILFLSMSSGISGSYRNAVFVASELEEEYPERKIRLVDTKGASLGEGIVVLKAADRRDEGADLDTVYKEMLVMSDDMYQVFTVGDLMHLRATGRLSNAKAVIGTLLRIKAVLKGDEEGKIVAFANRPGRKKAMALLAQQYQDLVEDPEENIVGIAHAGCREDAEELAAMIREIAEPKEIMIVDYEPVTGSHVGPQTLALFFRGKPGCRFK